SAQGLLPERASRPACLQNGRLLPLRPSLRFAESPHHSRMIIFHIKLMIFRILNRANRNIFTVQSNFIDLIRYKSEVNQDERLIAVECPLSVGSVDRT
ncbi:hypothetical protein, partial [Victivallis vadensis]